MLMAAFGLAAYLWPKTTLVIGVATAIHKAWPALVFNLFN